jgi:DnaK suppressor protein
MPEENGGFGKDFIEEQRIRLEALREELARTVTQAGTVSPEETEAEDIHEPMDIADLGAIVTGHDIDQAVHKTAERRLRYVERALQKIAEGTYGLSEISGQRISKARLESVPEAIYTTEEARQIEAGSLEEPLTPARDGKRNVA